MNIDSNTVVALGTLALAVATGILAWQTQRLARQTAAAVESANKTADSAEQQARAAWAQRTLAEEQVDLSRRALSASIQPIMADVPTGMYFDRSTTTPVVFDNGPTVELQDAGVSFVPTEAEHYAYCSIALRNVGTGAAMIRGLGLKFNHVVWSGKATRTVVPVGELTRLTFTIPKDRPELRAGIDAIRNGGLTVELSYTDVGGGQLTTTRCHLTRDAGVDFHVRQLFLLRPGDETPFASSGPADS